MNLEQIADFINKVGLPIALLAAAGFWIWKREQAATDREEKREQMMLEREDKREAATAAKEAAWREERAIDRKEYVAALDKVASRVEAHTQAVERLELDVRELKRGAA